MDKNTSRIRIHKKTLKRRKITESEIKLKIKSIFGKDLKKSSNNLLYFKSKKIYNYLNAKFILEPYWDPIDKNEEEELLKK